MKKLFGGAFVLISVLAFTGCGSSSQADCLTVDSALGNSIVGGAESGTGAQFVRASAVKSPDFENVFFIAVEFSAMGVSNQVGVFASNSLADGGGIIMAANRAAKQFTIWPDADRTQASISGVDPSIATAKACLN
jgi:hypothetical protein